MTTPLFPQSRNPPVSRIGRFYVQRELGRGTAGMVYLAHDPVIDRDVAIKTFDAAGMPVERKRHLERIINEARAAGRLSHPNIVTIFDAVHEGDVAWITMEYLRGETLAQMLNAGHRFKPEDVASIAWRIADALDHAHHGGVIHRDVKPSNIFINHRHKPILVDFGIARSPNRLASETEALDQAYTLARGRVVGTPNYMSPEQAAGMETDHRTDIYSLGAVMYEMLTGSKPFTADDTDRLLEMVMSRDPVAPHLRNQSVPVELSEITMKAMSKRQVARYQHAEELVRHLKRYLITQKRKRNSMHASIELLSHDKEFPREWSLLGWVSALALAVTGAIAGVWLLR